MDDRDQDADDAEFTDDEAGEESRLAVAQSDRLPVQHRAVDATAYALAQAERARIEAQVLIARQYPRHLPAVRERIRQALRRPSIAERAMYALPRGDKSICQRCGGDWKGKHNCPPGQYQMEKMQIWVPNIVEGESVKMAMMMMKAHGNMSAGSRIVGEDENRRTVRVYAVDWESMTFEEDEVSVTKTIERKATVLRYGADAGKVIKPDRQIISERKNSKGEVVYICRATDAEVREMAAAAVSKAKRKCVLDLVDEDIKEDAKVQAKATARNAAAQNRVATIKNLKVNYDKIGVDQVMLADYLGRPIDEANNGDIEILSGLLVAITDRESGTTWESVMRSKAEAAASRAAAAANEAGDAATSAAAATDGTVKPPRTNPRDAVDGALGKPT